MLIPTRAFSVAEPLTNKPLLLTRSSPVILASPLTTRAAPFALFGSMFIPTAGNPASTTKA